MSKTFSKEEVAGHKTPQDLFIIVDDDVYDMTQFQSEHPGGQKSGLPYVHQNRLELTSHVVLQRVGGKDASKQFWKYHNEGILKKFKGQLQVGSLTSKKAAPLPTPPATSPPAEKTQDKVKPQAESGAVVPMPTKDAQEAKESLDPYGALIPYADPSWYQSVSIPAFVA